MRTKIAVTLLFFLALSPIYGHEIDYEGSKGTKFEFDLPDGMALVAKGDLLSITSKDGQLWIGVREGQGEDSLLELTKNVVKKIDKALTDTKLAEAVEGELHGMPAILIEGTGKDNDKPVKILLVVFEVDDDHRASMLFVGAPKVTKTYKQTIKEMINSILPTFEDLLLAEGKAEITPKDGKKLASKIPAKAPKDGAKLASKNVRKAQKD